MGLFILVLHLEGLEPRVLRYNPLACALFLFVMQYKIQIHYNLCNVVSTSCAPLSIISYSRPVTSKCAVCSSSGDSWMADFFVRTALYEDTVRF